MHKTFISYHHKNEQDLKDELIKRYGGDDFIDKSVKDGDIDTNLSEETIMRKIKEDFLGESTVTLVLIGFETAQRPFVNSEIQASLWGNNPNGLLAVVRDDVYSLMYNYSRCTDSKCNCGQEIRVPTDYHKRYLPDLIYKNRQYKSDVPHFTNSQVYCSLIKWSTFINNPETHINEAFDKRSKEISIAKKLSPETPKI
ncbi:TIR domain-containing protein [Bacillus haynesii]|uniref:TIR domain-containing protein n=1 Tax=Bacillus haynesii TaxID=1925021 RepID=UPI0022826BEB|nr:TIR domain-containing protein [Bacillus haynesii]MCY8343628.1 TIR domain-containing protein [Bacillus haynesii]MEC0753591.1 TIR domain-containing protein [Bacillus haynesii]